MAEEQSTPDINNPDISAVSEDASASNDEILKQLGSDYAEYMKLDTKKEVSRPSLGKRKMTQVGRTKYVTQKNLLLWLSSFPMGRNHHVFITARKRSFRRLRFHRCLSVHSEGGVCPIAFWGRPG